MSAYVLYPLAVLSLRAPSSYKVLLTDCEPFGSQNVISRSGVKIKIRLRERQQKILRREFEFVVARFKTHISTLKGVNLGRIERHQVNYGGCNHLTPVSYTHLRAHETDSYLVCRL